MDTSLSPHRSLAFASGPDGATHESGSETEAAKDADAPNFEQSILDNLAKAGIQNGRRKERITFASFETYAGQYVQAIGERARESRGDTATRVAIAIGPQYGTVSPSFVKKAAREAINAEGVDLLCVLGFAFDAQVTGITEDDGVTVVATDEGFANVAATRKMGRIPVLMVRMNPPARPADATAPPPLHRSARPSPAPGPARPIGPGSARVVPRTLTTPRHSRRGDGGRTQWPPRSCRFPPSRSPPAPPSIGLRTARCAG
jgi:hypothetical protein